METNTERITTEVVHVVHEDNEPNIVALKSKNGGSVRFFKLTPLEFDEFKMFIEELTRRPQKKEEYE